MHPMTETNLKSAFAGESQAHMRYLIFADIADKEGKPNVARLFRGVATAETVHATNHFRNLAHLKEGSVTVAMAGFGPRNTLDNLDIAIEGETFEINEMYPVYIEVAKFQKEDSAVRSMNYAFQTEKVHQALYARAIEAVKASADMKLKDLFICDVCGWTVEGEPPDKCPLCAAKKERFLKF